MYKTTMQESFLIGKKKRFNIFFRCLRCLTTMEEGVMVLYTLQ